MVISRRDLFRAGAATAAVTTAAALQGCRSGNQPIPNPPSSSASARATRAPGAVEMWLDESRWPAGWTDELTTAVRQRGTRLDLNPTAQLAASLQTRMGTPDAPDLVLDGGVDMLGAGQYASGLVDLTAVTTAAMSDAEGTPLRSLLRPGTLEAGISGKHLVRLPWVHVVHGLWFSRSLFDDQGWAPPQTWEDLLTLGEQASTQKMHLFCWARETATSFLGLTLASAIKQGGHEVRRALDGLEPRAWSHPAIRSAVEQMHTAVQAGFVRPGGSRRSWQQILPMWAEDGQVLMVPAGSWIISQAQVGAGFGLDVVPDPAVDHDAALPPTALHAGPAMSFMAPKPSGGGQGRAIAVVQEAFSAAVAGSFSNANQVLMTRADVTPETPGPVLQRQLDLVEAAGKEAFHWQFIEQAGATHDHQVLWNSFLEGQLDTETLLAESQRISDLLAADPRVQRTKVL